MKKSLLALAAAGAFAGAAQAQSSVTVYGILDVGYIGASQTGTGTQGTVKQTSNAFGQSAETGSRLGFRGTEDLGGGRSAFFTVELGLTPSTSFNGATTGVNQNIGGGTSTASPFNNRQSFVGLSQKGLGQFAIGTQYTPIFNLGSVTSAGQYNNLVGDVIYPVNVLTTQANTAANAPFGLTGQLAGASGGFTNRVSSALTVRTERMSGLQFQGMYVMNSQTQSSWSTTSPGENNNSGWGLGADFTWQKLQVVAAVQQFKALSNTLAGTPLSSTIWNAAMDGRNVQDNQWYVGGSYDFGILKAFAQYVNRNVTSLSPATTANDTMKRTAQQIGVRGYATKQIEGWASIGSGQIDVLGTAAGQGAANFVGWQLGSNYWLSKRTNLYAIYGSTQTSNVANATPANGGQGVSASNYAVGVRHTF